MTNLIIKTYLQVISFHKLLFISIKKNSFQLKNSFHNSKNKNSFNNNNRIKIKSYLQLIRLKKRKEKKTIHSKHYLQFLSI